MIVEVRVRTGPVECEIKRCSVPDIVIGELGSLVSESWDDVETLTVDEGVRWIGSGPVKCSRSVTSYLNLVRPGVGVEGVEVLVEDEAVLVRELV